MPIDKDGNVADLLIAVAPICMGNSKIIAIGTSSTDIIAHAKVRLALNFEARSVSAITKAKVTSAKDPIAKDLLNWIAENNLVTIVVVADSMSMPIVLLILVALTIRELSNKSAVMAILSGENG